MDSHVEYKDNFNQLLAHVGNKDQEAVSGFQTIQALARKYQAGGGNQEFLSVYQKVLAYRKANGLSCD